MAITFVNSGRAGSATVAEPSGVQEADLLVVIVGNDGGSALSAPAGWTRVGDDVEGGSFDTVYSVWVITRGSSAPDLEWTGDTDSPFHHIGVWRGDVELVVVDSASSAPNTAVAPSVTATDSGQLLICLYGDSDWGAEDVPPGMTDRSSGIGADTSLIADEVLGSSGATGTRTFSGGDPSAAYSLIIAEESAEDEAEVTAAIPLTLDIAAESATDHEATASIPLTLDVAPTTAATHQAQATIPLTLDVAAEATATHQATAAIPLTLDLTATTAAQHDATATIPLALDLAPTAQAPGINSVQAAIELALGIAPQTATQHSATAAVPLTLALTPITDDGDAPTPIVLPPYREPAVPDYMEAAVPAYRERPVPAYQESAT